jgi:hypothetical protein
VTAIVWREAPHGHGWAHYVFGVALHALVFAVVGPGIGGLAASGLVFAPFGLMIAYMMMIPAAALTGVIVGASTGFVHTPWKLYVLAAFAGAILACGYAMLMPLIKQKQDVKYLLWLLAPSGAIAAVACTRILKQMRLTRGNKYFR